MLKGLFNKIARFINDLLDILLGRHYLLFDGTLSCAYIPKHTYRYLNKLLLKSLDRNPKAENSLRFLWSRILHSDQWALSVNPADVEMISTHGLTLDTHHRILIPCPYIQQIYLSLDLQPEWCGRLYLDKLNIDVANSLINFSLKGGTA